MERKVLRTLTANTKTAGLKLNQTGTAQSMAVIDKSTVVVFRTHSDLTTSIGKFLPTGAKTGGLEKTRFGLGHCNGATYCPVNDSVYVAIASGSKHTKRIAALDSYMNIRFTFDLPVSVSSIAFDKDNNKFYCRKGSKLYKFDRSVFAKNGDRSKTPFSHTILGSTGQDICVYNKKIYCVVKGSKNSYIDIYNTSTLAYVGSIKLEGIMAESCDFNGAGQLIYLASSPDNRLVWTGLSASKLLSESSGSSDNSKKTRKVKANLAFVHTANQELKAGVKEHGNNNVKYTQWCNMVGQPWCAIFIRWCATQTFGEKGCNTIFGTANKYNAAMQDNLEGPWIKPKSGLIRKHIGIIKSVSGTTAKTIEGNTGSGAVGSRTVTVPAKTRPGDIITFNGTTVVGIKRPKWPDGLFEISDDGSIEEVPEEELGTISFNQTASQLYSSENYKYIEQKKDDGSERQNLINAQQASIKGWFDNVKQGSNLIPVKSVPDMMLPKLSTISSSSKKRKTKLSGSISGNGLPSTLSYVEAPYISINLGGVDIGTYKNGHYPNYLNSINIKKTNGSLNEYTINLTHQISPGDNPNYIDNLISANGYNKIKITYGDANDGIEFTDINALLVNAKSNFDFFNNSINYTLSATSSAVMSAIQRRNYPEVTARPSEIINNMLYKSGELLQYFPSMQSSTFTNSHNLIPSTDKEVTIGAMDNIVPLNYLNKLVGAMSPISGNGIYYLSILDEKDTGPYFKIEQINTDLNVSSFPLIYEIDINYPNENSLVYNFSVDSDYAWPLAYEYGGGFSNYNYDIDSRGNILSSKTSSVIKSTAATKFVSEMDKNWWTNVTEFPVTATLEVKGLTSHILLLNYIKVNVFYFGNKLRSSGIYIVTGQEDNLSGSGFRTRLNLLRVAGDNQYINVDGRIIT